VKRVRGKKYPRPAGNPRKFLETLKKNGNMTFRALAGNRRWVWGHFVAKESTDG